MIVHPVHLKPDFHALLKNLPCDYNFFWLDSSLVDGKLGRYSFVGLEPRLILRSRGNVVEIKEKGHSYTHTGNPLAFIDNIMQEYNYLGKNLSNYPFPFAGGLVGYLAYDLQYQIRGIPRRKPEFLPVYDQYWGLYDTFLVHDHIGQKLWAVGSSPSKIRKLLELINSIPKLHIKSPSYMGELKSNLTKAEYIKKINEVKKYIKAGDIKQINLSQVFSFDFTGHPLDYYRVLRRVNPAHFGAYLHYPDYDIISISPERLVNINDNTLETRPIKGTMPRGMDQAEDAYNREKLAHSPKENAELKMVVDMESDNLEAISLPDSIRVADAFQVNAYATIFHLEALINSSLKPDISYEDIIRAIFPGSSITGIPKKRAMEVIDELEANHRGIYTGSIGYIDFRGNVDLNIAIRTTLMKNGVGYYPAGGGLTIDSNAEEEYQETWDKTKSLLLTRKEINHGK